MQRLIEEQKHHIHIVLAVVVFTVFFGLAFFILNSGNLVNMIYPGSAPKIEATPQARTAPEVGTSPKPMGQVGLRFRAPQSVRVQQQTEVSILADSRGKDIVAFDIVLPVTDRNVSVEDVVSARPDYDVYTTVTDRVLVITGSRKIQTSASAPLANEPLITFTISAKKAGSYNLQIISEQGLNKTRFYDDLVMPLAAQITNSQIAVKN